MENNVGGIPSKDKVIETVIDIFIRVIGFIEREEVSRTSHIVKDFTIDGDDLSLFLMEVEKHFGIKPITKEWSSFEPTMERIADFVLQHLSKKP